MIIPLLKCGYNIKKLGNYLLMTILFVLLLNFTKSDFDHIICYYSKEKDYALLLCKIFSKYFNIQIPADTCSNFKTSVIATYV